jgi:hypothetical protein
MGELHCWKDQREHVEETEGQGSEAWTATWVDGDGTCMLAAGHDGPHEFTPDDQIGVSFPGRPRRD